ncbi:D-Ala-D-Ala carboxypeptidase family metallohydrolase [Lysobacter firmicutimachus]|uniref:D-Ala-D-Ala carboxypeptidase family metallohydrolase n=1 Tax=Lysobacter firmicutimachus TaxID=1792846 RepID=A0AAU8MP22_9GAMM
MTQGRESGALGLSRRPLAPSGRARLIVVLLAAAVAMSLSLRRDGSDTPEQRYQAWLARGHRAQAEAYRAFLRTHGVADVLPLRQLLRSGRHWRRCGVDEFVVPPRTLWAATVPSLRLIRELRAQGWLNGATVQSAYRDERFNRCEGGSRLSRHRHGGAYDFDLAADAPVRALCAFWRRRGAAAGFGLGFYDRRHRHVDTAGFRTWGGDFRRGTSLCQKPSQGSPPDGAAAPRRL